MTAAMRVEPSVRVGDYVLIALSRLESACGGFGAAGGGFVGKRAAAILILGRGAAQLHMLSDEPAEFEALMAEHPEIAQILITASEAG